MPRGDEKVGVTVPPTQAQGDLNTRDGRVHQELVVDIITAGNLGHRGGSTEVEPLVGLRAPLQACTGKERASSREPSIY